MQNQYKMFKFLKYSVYASGTLGVLGFVTLLGLHVYDEQCLLRYVCGVRIHMWLMCAAFACIVMYALLNSLYVHLRNNHNSIL